MPGVQAGAPPSPQLFFETVTAFHKTEALLKPGGREVMLAATPAGDAYTFSEHQRMLRIAGYSSVEN